MGAATVIQREGIGYNPDSQECAHVHFALPDADCRHVWICDAGTDEVARYALNGKNDVAQTPDLILTAPPGSLPRHMCLSHDKRRLFVVSELGNLVSVWSLSNGGAHLMGHVSSLTPGHAEETASAAIRLHPNGRHLFSSNRGDDSVAVYDVSDSDCLPRLLGRYPSDGATPREFTITPNGRHLLVANQDAHSLVLLAFDEAKGSLSQVGAPFKTGSPVCV